MELPLDRKTGLGSKTLLLLVAFVATNFIPRIATFAKNRLFFLFWHLDPDAVFVPSFIHHIIQGLIAFSIIAIVARIQRKPLREFGFNMSQSRWSLKITGIFCIIWIILYCGGAALFIPPTQTLAFPNNIRNIVGNLLYMLTMPGPSEEILFRALPYMILGFAWTGSIKIFRLALSHKAIITAVLFAIAHIGFNFFPFQIYYIDATQQVLAFSLGLFYGYMFDKTGSLLGPVLVHAASDFLGSVAVTAVVLLK